MHTASAPPARVPPRRRRGRTVSAALALAVAFGALDVPAFIAGAPQQASAQERRFPFFDWGNSRQPERPQRRTPQPEPRRSVFPFFNWGGSEDSPRYRVYPDETERPVRRKPVAQNDPTRPPAPKKLEHEPAKTVLVFGDGMADWLSYGLEDAFEDPGEFGAVRKVRANTGLIQNEPRELDWVQNIRETFAKERADFVVMMIGLGDRHGIRERVAPRTGQPQPIDPTQQPNIMAPEAERAGKEQAEFRSDRWTELYAKRVAEVMNALKAKHVPVMWVGLPPIRGAKARVDVSALNDIYRAEAQKAGVTFVDVFEGFVDDSGDFAMHGPDVIGQVRRLRANDGVNFTRAGARKLAHFVDREIKRGLNRESPLLVPLPEAAEKGETAGRPVAGPVLPLTGAAGTPEGLLGAAAAVGPRDPNSVAVKVLVKGEAPPALSGRADDFAWPHQQPASENEIVEPLPDPVASAPRAVRPAGGDARPRPTGRPAGAASPAARSGAQRTVGDSQAATPARPVR